MKLARRAETAEQLGLLLRERYERNARGMDADQLLDAQVDDLERRLVGR